MKLIKALNEAKELPEITYADPKFGKYCNDILNFALVEGAKIESDRIVDGVRYIRIKYQPFPIKQSYMKFELYANIGDANDKDKMTDELYWSCELDNCSNSLIKDEIKSVDYIRKIYNFLVIDFGFKHFKTSVEFVDNIKKISRLV